MHPTTQQHSAVRRSGSGPLTTQPSSATTVTASRHLGPATPTTPTGNPLHAHSRSASAHLGRLAGGGGSGAFNVGPLNLDAIAAANQSAGSLLMASSAAATPRSPFTHPHSAVGVDALAGGVPPSPSSSAAPFVTSKSAGTTPTAGHGSHLEVRQPGGKTVSAHARALSLATFVVCESAQCAGARRLTP